MVKMFKDTVGRNDIEVKHAEHGLSMSSREAALALKAIDLKKFQSELEKRSFAWYLVDGAVAFLNKKHDWILREFEQHKEDRASFEGIVSVMAELYIKEYTPAGWQEPIRVPVGSIDFRLTKYIGEVVVDAVFSHSK